MRNFKKKLAGFMAAVMAFSMIPAMPVFALDIEPETVELEANQAGTAYTGTADLSEITEDWLIELVYDEEDFPAGTNISVSPEIAGNDGEAVVTITITVPRASDPEDDGETAIEEGTADVTVLIIDPGAEDLDDLEDDEYEEATFTVSWPDIEYLPYEPNGETVPHPEYAAARAVILPLFVADGETILPVPSNAAALAAINTALGNADIEPLASAAVVVPPTSDGSVTISFEDYDDDEVADMVIVLPALNGDNGGQQGVGLTRFPHHEYVRGTVQNLFRPGSVTYTPHANGPGFGAWGTVTTGALSANPIVAVPNPVQTISNALAVALGPLVGQGTISGITIETTGGAFVAPVDGINAANLMTGTVGRVEVVIPGHLNEVITIPIVPFVPAPLPPARPAFDVDDITDPTELLQWVNYTIFPSSWALTNLPWWIQAQGSPFYVVSDVITPFFIGFRDGTHTNVPSMRVTPHFQVNVDGDVVWNHPNFTVVPFIVVGDFPTVPGDTGTISWLQADPLNPTLSNAMIAQSIANWLNLAANLNVLNDTYLGQPVTLITLPGQRPVRLVGPAHDAYPGLSIGVGADLNPQANTPFAAITTLANVPINTQFMAENNILAGPPVPPAVFNSRVAGPVLQAEVTGTAPNLNLLHDDTRNLVVGSVLQIEFPLPLRNYLYNFHYAGGPQLTPVGTRPGALTSFADWNERYWVVEVQITGGTFHWGAAHVAFPVDLPNIPLADRGDGIQPHNPGGAVRGADFGGTIHTNLAHGNRAHIYIPISMIVEGHASPTGSTWNFGGGLPISFGVRGVAGLNPTVNFGPGAHGNMTVAGIAGAALIHVPMPIRTTIGDGNVQVGVTPGTQAFIGEVNSATGAFSQVARPPITNTTFFPGIAPRQQTLQTPTGAVNLATAAEAGRTITTTGGTGVDRNTLRFNVTVAEQSIGGLPTHAPITFNAGHGGEQILHNLTGAFELVAPAGFRWPESLATTVGAVALPGQFNHLGVWVGTGGTHTITPAQLGMGTHFMNVGTDPTAGLTPLPTPVPFPVPVGQVRVNLVDVTVAGPGFGIGIDQGWYTIGSPQWAAAGGIGQSLELLPHAALGITSYRATVSQDGTVLRVEYRGSGVRQPGAGNIVLRDVILQAVNLINPPEQAVYISIRNIGQASPVPNNFPTEPNLDTTTVTPQTGLYVGTTSDWAINMTVSGDVPELVSGRLISANIQNPNPVHHRAARVRVNENIVDSWWTERVTTFSLTEGVRIREVVFSGVDNIQNADIAVLEDQRHFNLNRADSQNVRINHGVLQVHNLRRQPNQRTAHGGGTIGFYMDIYLNIPANFEGPINLYLGEQVPSPNAPDTRSVTIAHATPPITVTTELTSIRVGYQFMPVGNFTITENMAGALLLNEPVFISITDGLFSELQIAPSFNVAVTAGNIEISTPGVALGGNIWAAGIEPNIEFTIDGASTVPSTIHFSNVTARLAAVAPASTMGYDLVVWGSAVAQNVDHPRVTVPVAPGVGGWSQEGTAFHNIIGADAIQGTAGAIREANQINPRDLFNTLYAGIATPYLFLDEHFIGHPIVSSPVTFQEDGVVIVGGVAQNFDPAVWGAFEVNNSGVGVLPARLAFAVLFEGADPYDVDLFQWEAPASRFVIDSTGHNIWFQTGNTTMGVRGGTHTIMSGTGAAAFPYAAYVNPVTERMMLPIRAFADALGLDVQFIEGVGGGPASIVLTP